MIVTQQLGPNLPYGAVPEPRAQKIGLILVFTYIWQEEVVIISEVPGALRNKIQPGKNMVSRCNHLLHHDDAEISVTIHLHLANFCVKKCFKKIS